MKTEKRPLFRILAVFVALSCLLSSLAFSAITASAEDDELEDLQQQYNDLEKQIEKNREDLNEVQGDIKDNKKKLSTLNDEIDSINAQIDILNSRINKLSNNIADIENNIAATNEEIEKTNQEITNVENQIEKTRAYMEETRQNLMGRIRENYMNGESSTLEILFSSEDLESYFTRKELMTQVSAADAELIQSLTAKLSELDELQAQLEKAKAKLEEKNAKLEEQKAELNAKQEDLENSKSGEQSKKRQATSKQQEVMVIFSELDENSAEYKAEIKRQEAEKEKLSRQIDEYIREHGSTVGDTPDAAFENDGKMDWPVKFESYISAGYPAYSNGNAHWGIDICAKGGNTRGRPFNAAQGGKVILAANDGEWNYGFGNYCVIDHGDGTQTLYAHSDGLKVSVGQIVKKGQEIGIIGMTGNTTGPHLHFEVRVKNADGSVSRVQPLNYVTNPYD